MRGRVRIAILDAADRRMGAAVAAVFATSFPERPLQVRLFDPEPEFLDLIERLWRLLLLMEKAPHEVRLCATAEEAIEEAHAVLSLKECAEGNEVPIPAADQWVHWPKEGDLRFWPHQILRWIRLDENPFELLRLHARTPLHGWIDAVVSRAAHSR
ncbi:MAG: hypothetical protein N2109_04610 [Fimbriimonadales bacterium]|nr:hypothetical protein [Fimbriimonadales bacterium]